MSQSPTGSTPPLGAGTEAAAGRVPFVSRSAHSGSQGVSVPGWRNPWLLGITLLTLLLQGISWRILDGYQVADSVEYLEHAQAFSRGEKVVDSQIIRSYGFISLLTPLFLLSDWFGLEDLRILVWIARGMQMLFGVLLVHACARIGTRLAGRGCGLVAAFLVAVNPVFLQYSVSPIADIAAALCVGLGTDQALARGAERRRGLITGLWFGAALMIAYKTILVTGPILVFLVLRDRKQLGFVSKVIVGLSIAVVAQVGLDKAVYGKWGVSLGNYVLVNTTPIVPYALRDLGFQGLAKKYYDLAGNAAKQEGEPEDDPGDLNATANSKTPKTWYLTHMPSMLVWPVIVGGALGILLCLVRASWTSTLLLFVFLANFAVMSQKGSKDFRLWLPLMPFIAPLCAWGLHLLWRQLRGPTLLRIGAATAVLALTFGLGMHTLLDRNTRKFSGYWDAMRIISADAAESRDPGSPKVKVASAYHWAVFLRESRDMELVKLPHHLSRWNAYTSEQQGESVAAILEQDWFITHMAVLSNEGHQPLMKAVNEGFEVHSLLWDHADYEDIGPVFVLRRRREGDTREPLGRRFFNVTEVDNPEDYRREHLLPPAMRFLRDFPGLGKREEVWLLGWEFENIPGDGHGWITYHWYCVEGLIADYQVLDRLTTEDEVHSWQNNHWPCYRVLPTPTWETGHVYRESWPVVAATEPYDWQSPFRPMGGPYRRGDLMPATLWMDLATLDDTGVTGRMEAARFGQEEPVRSGAQADIDLTPDGFAFSKDGMVRVGRLFVPVHERARVPDDGRVIQE